MEETERPRVDTNSKTAQLVQLISEIGPDIPEISRRLGQYKESVRYRYKVKILDKGFAVQAAVDYEKLGLKRVMFVAAFHKAYKPYANTILSAMNELCYVVFFAKTLPKGVYIVDAAVPAEFVESYTEFILALKQRGLFSLVEVFAFEWGRNPPMRAEFYDFDAGRWDFDWSGPSALAAQGTTYEPLNRERFDMVDLLILKELQTDATRPLTEISAKLGVNYKKLAWHYTTHVTERQLIKSYRLNWMGTRYDFELEKALHRKHRYLSLAVLVKNTSDYERMELMSKSNRLPFLWFEAAGRHYYADFAFPIDSITEAFVYLESSLEAVKDRAEYYVLDSANALTFTMSYQLYDQDQKKWVFDGPELLSRFENLLMKIKE
jgi:hypothetical protein